MSFFSKYVIFFAKNALSKFYNVIFHQDFSPKAAADQQKSLKTQFQNLECNFPPGFLAEGRRGQTKTLENMNMGIYMDTYIYIYIYILIYAILISI